MEVYTKLKDLFFLNILGGGVCGGNKLMCTGTHVVMCLVPHPHPHPNVLPTALNLACPLDVLEFESP